MRKWIAAILALCLLLCGCTVEMMLVPAEDAAETLTVHFIDVGQADCTLLECGGEFLLIDGGNRDDSRKVVSYLQNCGVEQLHTVVCTHAHEDHVGGLPGVLAVFPVGQVFSPTKTYASDVYDSFLHYVDQQRQEVIIPAPGDTFSLGGAEVLILGPVDSYANTNNTSIVLMVTFGENRFLFTGDMERDAENEMLDYWKEEFDWNVDVLKVGHHGSSTSSGYRFIYRTDPDYGIVPCEKGNSYGHPHRETIKLFRDAGIPMLRTDELGTIVAVSDGFEISITWENQKAAPADVPPAEDVPAAYIGNKRSRTLHSPYCSGLPKKENQIYFDYYNAAIDSGYVPCITCLG